MTYFKNAFFCLAALALLAGASWGVWRWVTYPEKPNLAAVSVDDAIAFIGTEDFGRLFESDRKQYCLDVVEKMREKSFPELVGMLSLGKGGDRRRAAANIRSLEEREVIEGAMLRLILDKFYEETPEKRAVYLTGLVMMDQAAKQQGKGTKIPSPDRLRKDMAKIIGRQSPQTVARFGQFLVDVEQQRRNLGLGASY